MQEGRVRGSKKNGRKNWMKLVEVNRREEEGENKADR